MSIADQSDLFRTPIFETREAKTVFDVDLFRYRLKTGMSQTLRAVDADRYAVAEEIARLIARPSFSKAQLDNLLSPAKTDRDVSLLVFKAFCRVMDAHDLWDMVLSDDGLLVLCGDEARLAEIGRLQQEEAQIRVRLRELRSKPVDVKRG